MSKSLKPFSASERRVYDRVRKGVLWLTLGMVIVVVTVELGSVAYRSHQLGEEMSIEFQTQLNRTLRLIAKEFGSRAPSRRELANVSRNLVSRSSNILRADIVDSEGRGLRAFFKEGDDVRSVGWVPSSRQTRFLKVRDALEKGEVKAHTFRIVSISRHRYALKAQVLYIGSTGGSLSKRGVLITFRYKTSPILHEPFSSIRQLALKGFRPTLVSYSGEREGFSKLSDQMKVLGYTAPFPLRLFRFDEKLNPRLLVSYHLPTVGWWFLRELIVPLSFLLVFVLIFRAGGLCLVRTVFRELSEGAPLALGQLQEVTRLVSSIDFLRMSELALELPARSAEAAESFKKVKEELTATEKQLVAVERQLLDIEAVQAKLLHDPERIGVMKDEAVGHVEQLRFELDRTEQSLSSFKAFEDIVNAVGKKLGKLSDSGKSSEMERLAKWMHRLEDLSRSASRTSKLQVDRVNEVGVELGKWSERAAEELKAQDESLGTWDTAAVAFRGQVRRLRVDFDRMERGLTSAEDAMAQLSDQMKDRGGLDSLVKDLKGLGVEVQGCGTDKAKSAA